MVSQIANGSVKVTRQNMDKKIVSYTIHSEYDAFQIGRWLYDRQRGIRHALVQVAFPSMSDEDREFLITGITPNEWKHLFPSEKEE
jgi:hypothetical protein